MIRISISEAAFEAIAKTLPLGSVGYENEVDEKGERYVWLPPNVAGLPWQCHTTLSLHERDGSGRCERYASQ